MRLKFPATFLAAACLCGTASAQTLVISEYSEGSGFNKALEIQNVGSSTVDLSTYAIEVYNNGAATPNSTTSLSAANLAAGDVWVISHPSADAGLLALADQTSGNMNWNGDDAVVLTDGGTFLDVIGQVGFDPGTSWTNGGVTTLNAVMRRTQYDCIASPVGSDVFEPNAEYSGGSQNDFSNFGTAAFPLVLTNCFTPSVPASSAASQIAAAVLLALGGVLVLRR